MNKLAYYEMRVKILEAKDPAANRNIINKLYRKIRKLKNETTE